MHYLRCMQTASLLEGIVSGDKRLIARAITLVENDLPGAEELMQSLPVKHELPVFGVTGPPGAGKSTLISSMIRELCASPHANGHPNRIAVVAVDPTSPFTHGSLLGDRLRMQEHFNHPQVFIRSLATRGALGGLSARTLEVCDILRSAPFDYLFIETVGVGQSEVEIIALADTVAVTLVPEAGDEIQALKSGIMEIGDIFVVNKSDREGADRFAAGIIKTLHERPIHGSWQIPVIKTMAGEPSGIHQLLQAFRDHAGHRDSERKLHLMAQRAYRLIQDQRMKGVSIVDLEKQLAPLIDSEGFNLYRFIADFR